MAVVKWRDNNSSTTLRYLHDSLSQTIAPGVESDSPFLTFEVHARPRGYRMADCVVAVIQTRGCARARICV